MNDSQRNEIAMLKTVRTFMGQNSAHWSGFPAFVTVTVELNTKIEEIDSSIAKQEAPTEGVTEDKAGARSALEELILEVGGAVFALANSQKPPNYAMAADVAVTPSDLDTMAEQRIDDVAMRAFQHATANKGALESDFGLSAARVAELDAARVAFQELKSNPRSAIATKAGETTTLPEKIRAAKSLLRLQLDKMMIKFRKADPVFYAGYQSARVIVDRHDPRGGGGATPPRPKP